MAAEHVPDALSTFTGWGSAVLIVFALISGITAGIVWLGRKIDKRIAQVHDQVESRTSPIQANANGGLSLPDVARNVEANAQALTRLAAANETFHQLLADKVGEVGARLDTHAASPAHDRRGQRTRKTDLQE